MPELSRHTSFALVSTAAVAAAALALTAAPTAAQVGPGLGVEATAEQIAAWSLTVLPDGTGLPPGSGTARAGESIYAQKCLACHGAGGQDGPNDRLAGGHGTLADAAPVKTIGSYWPYATTVFDYVRRAMPFMQPQSLTADETYALTAYLLYVNDIVGRDEVIDSQTLPAVEMPNSANFDWVWSASSGPQARTSAETEPTGEWQTLVIRVSGERVEGSLNGVRVLEADGIGNGSGHVGIQGEAGALEFRSLRLREL